MGRDQYGFIKDGAVVLGLGDSLYTWMTWPMTLTPLDRSE